MKKKKIALTIDELPVLKEGQVRLVHLAIHENALKIAEGGLDYKRQGMVMSTARAWSYENADKVEYHSEDPRFSGEGIKAVVIDLPVKEYKIHNSVIKAPGIIPPEYVVGVVEPKKKSKEKNGNQTA